MNFAFGRCTIGVYPASMKNWRRVFLYGLGSLLLLIVVPISVSYLYQYNWALTQGNAKLSEWKKSGWICGKDFELASRALVAAEDPSYLSQPRLDCGPFGILNAWRTKNEFVCSSLVTHAARLTLSEKYMRPLPRMFAELCMQSELVTKPDEVIDIILNKTYLGPKEDGTPIEGFEQAANFYFGQPLSSLGISKVALLAGMVISPSRFSPRGDAQRAKDRRDLVIDQMAKLSFISDSEASSAKREPLQ